MTFDYAVLLAQALCANFADMIVLGVVLTEWDHSQGYVVRVYHVPSQCPYTFAGEGTLQDRIKFIDDGLRQWRATWPGEPK